VVSLISSHFGAGEGDPAIDEVRRSLIHAQIGLAWALKNHSRRQDVLQAAELAPHLPPEACKVILASRHVPLAILVWMALCLQAAFEDRHTEDFRLMQIDATFNRMTDAIGAMDRIKTTVFPRQYAVFGTMFTAMFAYLLPLALVSGGGWPVVPFVMSVGFIFFALDGVAGSSENPFLGTYNDTPIATLARAIEIHLLEVLGDRDLPGPMEPVDGILM
jgi:putative membrane protein